jgi:hypothetical protein
MSTYSFLFLTEESIAVSNLSCDANRRGTATLTNVILAGTGGRRAMTVTLTCHGPRPASPPSTTTAADGLLSQGELPAEIEFLEGRGTSLLGSDVVRKLIQHPSCV